MKYVDLEEFLQYPEYTIFLVLDSSTTSDCDLRVKGANYGERDFTYRKLVFPYVDKRSDTLVLNEDTWLRGIYRDDQKFAVLMMHELGRLVKHLNDAVQALHSAERASKEESKSSISFSGGIEPSFYKRVFAITPPVELKLKAGQLVSPVCADRDGVAVVVNFSSPPEGSVVFLPLRDITCTKTITAIQLHKILITKEVQITKEASEYLGRILAEIPNYLLYVTKHDIYVII